MRSYLKGESFRGYRDSSVQTDGQTSCYFYIKMIFYIFRDLTTAVITKFSNEKSIEKSTKKDKNKENTSDNSNKEDNEANGEKEKVNKLFIRYYNIAYYFEFFNGDS